MKKLILLCVLGLVGCAGQHRAPSSIHGEPVAFDSMALGNIKASATKSIEAQNICFDVTIIAKGVAPEAVGASNWSAAWVDKKDQYHLLTMHQRDPASSPEGGTIIAPYGAYQEWTNDFKTCAPKARLGNVKSLVLTAKELPYKDTKGLVLTWK